MSSIVLGQIADSGRKASLDLDVMLRTRLLVQANSGGGKSWLLRRLAEQLFGKIPVILIDPEGEFSTLRERYGYVLVGKGGETPADTRSAALVAHKLLELRASAVCDLYEMPAHERHRWVRLFLEALIDAPKRLWRPTVVIVDESHVYVPEKGQGESEAFAAMAGLVTRGRKRGFGAVFATQRLAKLSKNVSAEMLNRLVGQTFEDLDLDRAADLLSVPKRERLEFFRQMKVIEPGHFWAFGRALAKNRLLVKVGPVMTTHPEPGTAGYAATPPPAPDKVKALLPKLADLPKQAEEKARTEAELRTEIRSLKGQLAARPRETVEKPVEKLVHVPVLSDAQVKGLTAVTEKLAVTVKALDAVRVEITRSVNTVLVFKPPLPQKASVRDQPRSHPITYAPLADPKAGVNATAADGNLTGPEQRIVDGLAELEALGVQAPARVQVAFLAGYTNLASKGFVNGMSSLHSSGRIEYPDRGTVNLSNAGRQLARPCLSPRSSTELQERLISLLGGPEGRVLRPLIDSYPDPIDRLVLMGKAGYTNAASKGFVNAMSRLRSLGFIDYPSSKQAVAKPVLFLEA